MRKRGSGMRETGGEGVNGRMGLHVTFSLTDPLSFPLRFLTDDHDDDYGFKELISVTPEPGAWIYLLNVGIKSVCIQRVSEALVLG